jgi:hypothetical protein
MLAVAIRYVLPDKNGQWHCFEDPVAILDIFSDIRTANASEQQTENTEIALSGQAIGETLLRIAASLGADLSDCIAQGYDGAKNFSSDRIGAAAIFMKQAPHAHYFHCAMHCLNLSASQAVSVPAIRHAQDIVQEVSACFRSSAKRTDLLKSCIAEAEDTRVSKTHLSTLCTTRFIERHTAIVCLRSLLPFVMEALTRMSSWHCSEARKTATMLSNTTCQSDFIVSLIVLETLSALLLPTTRALQKKDVNLTEALRNLGDLLISIKNLRTAETFSKLFEEAGQLAKLLDVTLTKPRTAKRSVHRPSSLGDDVSTEAYYRINVFYPRLDTVIADIDFRFSSKKQQIINICRVIPL